jgi:hypothetical protein
MQFQLQYDRGRDFHLYEVKYSFKHLSIRYGYNMFLDFSQKMNILKRTIHTLSHNVVSSTPCQSRIRNQVSGDRH